MITIFKNQDVKQDFESFCFLNSATTTRCDLANLYSSSKLIVSVAVAPAYRSSRLNIVHVLGVRFYVNDSGGYYDAKYPAWR